MGRYEGFDYSVFGATDSDALRKARVVESNVGGSSDPLYTRGARIVKRALPFPKVRVRIAIGHIHSVLRVDEKAARLPKLFPFLQEFSVLIENLDAIVTAVGDEQPSRGIHGDAMRHVELPGTRSFLPPRFDESPVFRKLQDTHARTFAISLVKA